MNGFLFDVGKVPDRGLCPWLCAVPGRSWIRPPRAGPVQIHAKGADGGTCQTQDRQGRRERERKRDSVNSPKQYVSPKWPPVLAD